MKEATKGARFVPVEGWGKLPPGYRYVEAAGVAVIDENRWAAEVG